MKRKQYTTEQIIGFLKAHEAGAKVADLIRKHGFAERSLYRWKSKYGGMEVSEAKLRGLLFIPENIRFRNGLGKVSARRRYYGRIRAQCPDVMSRSFVGSRFVRAPFTDPSMSHRALKTDEAHA